MNLLAETGYPTAERRSRLLSSKRIVAGFAMFASVWAATGCNAAGEDAASAAEQASQRPTATHGSYSPSPSWSPWSSTPGGSPRADVFRNGISPLPDNLELEALIDRICRLRKQDSSAVPRSPAPNHSEITTLEQAYDRLYASMNGLPIPTAGTEQWAMREERQQCPQVVPRAPNT